MLAQNLAERWFRYYAQAHDAPSRLVCFPHAGGSAPSYLRLAVQLYPGTEVLAVQYPGRLDRFQEPLIDDLAVLADEIHEALAGLEAKPTALFGHSMGALLAFEVARRMTAGGQDPVALFASSRRGPTANRSERLDLSDEALIASMTQLGGTNPVLLRDEESLQPILRVMRNDYRAIQNYRYVSEPKLDCPVVALIGDQDTRVTAAEAGRWAYETNSGCTLRAFPGGHFYVNDNCADVAETITGVMRRSEVQVEGVK